MMTRSVFDQWQGDNSWLIRAWAWTAIRSSSTYRSRSPNGIASSAVARTEAKLDQPSPGHGMGRGRGQLTLATCLVQPSVDPIIGQCGRGLAADYVGSGRTAPRSMATWERSGANRRRSMFWVPMRGMWK